MYGSTTKGDVVKRSGCILVYGSTTKGGVVKRSDCILVYGSTTKGDVVKRSTITYIGFEPWQFHLLPPNPVSKKNTRFQQSGNQNWNGPHF